MTKHEVDNALKDISDVFEYQRAEIARLTYQLSQYDILIKSIQAENEKLSLYKNLADEYGLSALDTMIAKAGEVMRERCCEATNKVKVTVAPGKATSVIMAHNLAAADCEEEISALPGVAIGDLK